MAGLPLIASRLSLSRFSNVILKTNITQNVKSLDLTLTYRHSRSTPFISTYISRRCYASSSSDSGKISKENSILGRLLNVDNSGPELSDKNAEVMRIRKQLEEENAKYEEEKAKATAKKNKWALMGFYFCMGSSLFGCSYFLYSLAQPAVDEEGNAVLDEFSDLPQPQQALGRIRKGFTSLQRFVAEPTREKLLPDPLTYPYIQPPYTVVLDLKGVLISADWSLKTGWRFKTRPFVENFLEQIAPPLFEIVVYTTENGYLAFPLIDALDKNGYIMYRLAKDSAGYINGQYVKCLDQLNRDLSKVIVVDWNSKVIKDNHRNVLLIPEWTGNDDDTALIDLGALLKTIATNKVEDVRDVLDYYQQFDDPMKAFRENQRKVLEQLEQSEKELKGSSQSLAQKWKPTFVSKPKV